MIITLTTDFGTQDGYAGAMKGVLLSSLPSATVVDLTHDVPPQDVMAGAFALAQAAPWFPPGTVHLAVVDPGVGSARHAIVVEHGGQRFVGPDNGLLTLAAPSPSLARVIDRVPAHWRVHATFHGRDLFARVAALLASGAPVEEVAGEAVTPTPLSLPEVRVGDGALEGEVLHVDRFGNLVTGIVPPFAVDDAEARGAAHVEIGGPGGSGSVSGIAGDSAVTAPLCTTYADVERGRVLGYLGSAGWLEVGVRDGSAASVLHAARGTRVRLVLRPARGTRL